MEVYKFKPGRDRSKQLDSPRRCKLHRTYGTIVGWMTRKCTLRIEGGFGHCTGGLPPILGGFAAGLGETFDEGNLLAMLGGRDWVSVVS